MATTFTGDIPIQLAYRAGVDTLAGP